MGTEMGRHRKRGGGEVGDGDRGLGEMGGMRGSTQGRSLAEEASQGRWGKLGQSCQARRKGQQKTLQCVWRRHGSPLRCPAAQGHPTLATLPSHPLPPPLGLRPQTHTALPPGSDTTLAPCLLCDPELGTALMLPDP